MSKDDLDTDRGDRLRQLRRERKWTQAAIADKLRVSETAVRLWERGGGITRTHAVTLERLYDVPAGTLADAENGDLPDLDDADLERAVDEDRDRFIRRQFKALHDRIRSLEAELGELRATMEQQAVELQPLVTAALSAVADRRSSEEAQPARVERRASEGRRRTDPGKR